MLVAARISAITRLGPACSSIRGRPILQHSSTMYDYCQTLECTSSSSIRAKRGASDNAAPPSKQPGAKKAKATDEIVFTHEMRPPHYTGNQLRVLSWNVAGLRALLRNAPHALHTLVTSQQADVRAPCRLTPHNTAHRSCSYKKQSCKWHTCHKYKQHWQTCSLDGPAFLRAAPTTTEKARRGWPSSPDQGTTRTTHRHTTICILTAPSVTPLATPSPPEGPLAADQEGRVLVAEFEPCYVVCVYVPNSGKSDDATKKLKRLEYRTDKVDGWDGKLAATLKVRALYSVVRRHRVWFRRWRPKASRWRWAETSTSRMNRSTSATPKAASAVQGMEGVCLFPCACVPCGLPPLSQQPLRTASPTRSVHRLPATTSKTALSTPFVSSIPAWLATPTGAGALQDKTKIAKTTRAGDSTTGWCVACMTDTGIECDRCPRG